MKAILQTVLKPQMTRMNTDEATGRVGTPLPAAARNGLSCRSPTKAEVRALPSRPPVLYGLLWLTMLFAGPASAATRYVWQDSPSPGPPYTNWTTAAHVIQDAVDAAQAGDNVLVAGGVYATGGRAVGTNQLVNRVAIDRAITVESLMGPEVTIIQGYQVPGTTNGDGAIRCVYLADGASLSGFTLTNVSTRAADLPLVDSSGAGVWCESASAVASNCAVTGNSAFYTGGGAHEGTLNDCLLTGNSAPWGGGAAFGTLNFCTLPRQAAVSSSPAGYPSGRRAVGTNLMVKRTAFDRAIMNRLAARATIAIKRWLFL